MHEARVHHSGLGAWIDHHAYSFVSSLGRVVRRPWATLLTIGVMAVALALPLGLWAVLDNVARTLQEYNQTVIEVAGHTDSVGSDAYNQKLSEQRANTVSSYLQSRGLNRERFIVVGAGKSRPIASNDTEAGRAQNRRVEITLVPIES